MREKGRTSEPGREAWELLVALVFSHRQRVVEAAATEGLTPGHAMALLKSGRIARAREALTRYLATVKQAQALHPEGCLRIVEGGLLADEGSEDAALEAFGRGVSILTATGSRLDLARAFWARGGFFKRSGRRGDATAEFERSRELFTQCGAVPERAAVDAELGRRS